MGAWRFDVPDADERAGRHIVAVVGSREHSGRDWFRLHIDVAGTLYEGRQGYSETDMDRIEERGDMDPGTGRVVAWMNFETPPLLDTRELTPLPMPIMTADVERLALNLRAYAHTRGAPRRDDDERAALEAARPILRAVSNSASAPKS